MTPREQIEKIVTEAIRISWGSSAEELVSKLAAQISAAEREAEERTVKLGGVVAKNVYDKGFKEGFTACREKTAALFSCDLGPDNVPCGTCGVCKDAKRIRQMTPDEK